MKPFSKHALSAFKDRLWLEWPIDETGGPRQRRIDRAGFARRPDHSQHGEWLRKLALPRLCPAISCHRTLSQSHDSSAPKQPLLQFQRNCRYITAYCQQFGLTERRFSEGTTSSAIRRDLPAWELCNSLDALSAPG